MKMTTTQPVVAALQRRIRQFYTRLNQHRAEQCYAMLDPQIRADAGSITLDQYSASLERFMAWAGHVHIDTIGPMHVHINESTQLYGNRDFATVQIKWQSSHGRQYHFKERWVRGPRGTWYTRGTGFVVPDDGSGR